MLNKFDYSNINYTLPNRTFEGSQTILLNNERKVELIQCGPAHTKGDCIVHVPDAKICYAGDLLFIGGTPIVWEGPFDNWIKACNTMIRLNCEVYVPGHGPVTSANGVAAVRNYLHYVQDETKKRFNQGLSVVEAAKSIDLGYYKTWTDSERIIVNVNTLYKSYGHPGEDLNRKEHGPLAMWKLMSEFA
jgi:cyclase